MPDRKKILILTPSTIEKARLELKKLKEHYVYLAAEAECGGGILEIDLEEIGFTFWLTRGKRTLDGIMQMIRDGIAYYDGLSEDERQLDPPLRLNQPDPWLDQLFCDQPKMATSYCSPDGPHPYLAMMFGKDELEIDLPLFIVMDAKRREEAIKILPKVKAHTWSKEQFNEPLAEALSAIGLYLEISNADEFTWFVNGLEKSLSYTGEPPRGSCHLATCNTSDLTANTVGRLRHNQVSQATQLKEQLKREAPYMQKRFYERGYIFMLGEIKLVLCHQWDVDAAITLLDQAITNAARPTLVERVRELFS